jgi:hypothetical protein
VAACVSHAPSADLPASAAVSLLQLAQGLVDGVASLSVRGLARPVSHVCLCTCIPWLKHIVWTESRMRILPQNSKQIAHRIGLPGADCVMLFASSAPLCSFKCMSCSKLAP